MDKRLEAFLKELVSQKEFDAIMTENSNIGSTKSADSTVNKRIAGLHNEPQPPIVEEDNELEQENVAEELDDEEIRKERQQLYGESHVDREENDTPTQTRYDDIFKQIEDAHKSPKGHNFVSVDKELMANEFPNVDIKLREKFDYMPRLMVEDFYGALESMQREFRIGFDEEMDKIEAEFEKNSPEGIEEARLANALIYTLKMNNGWMDGFEESLYEVLDKIEASGTNLEKKYPELFGKNNIVPDRNASKTPRKNDDIPDVNTSEPEIDEENNPDIEPEISTNTKIKQDDFSFPAKEELLDEDLESFRAVKDEHGNITVGDAIKSASDVIEELNIVSVDLKDIEDPNKSNDSVENTKQAENNIETKTDKITLSSSITTAIRELESPNDLSTEKLEEIDTLANEAIIKLENEIITLGLLKEEVSKRLPLENDKDIEENSLSK